MEENKKMNPEKDEISLVDLIVVVYKRKVLFLLTYLLCIVVGLFFAFRERKKIDVPSYEYKTILYLGVIMTEKGVTSLETPESVVERVKEADFVKVNEAFKSKNNNFKLTAKIEQLKNSQALSVITDSDEKIDFETISNYHKEILKFVIDRQNELILQVLTYPKVKKDALSYPKIELLASETKKFALPRKPYLFVAFGVAGGFALALLVVVFSVFLENLRERLRDLS